MPTITRTTCASLVAHASLDRREHRRLRAKAMARAVTVRSDGVTSCSRCTRYGACGQCATINMARLTASLIENHDDRTDHANNIAVPPMTGKFRGYRPVPCPRRSTPGLCAKIEHAGGGWRRGLAMLNGDVIYRGPATRDKAAAWDFATTRLAVIRMGL